MTNWIIFSYSLPSKSSSSPRVTLWRRLRRLGAISPAGGVYILPAKSECIEVFQWLACAWLIRRYINPQAVIRYTTQPEPDEVAFDMSGAEFGHMGSLCTFETMLRVFRLIEPGLSTLAEIVHEIDLHDERYMHPEIPGLEAILQGWLALNLTDADLEARGVALFDGLFADLSNRI